MIAKEVTDKIAYEGLDYYLSDYASKKDLTPDIFRMVEKYRQLRREIVQVLSKAGVEVEE